MHRTSSDLLQLINDVLDLAKVESGRMQLKLEPLNMQDILVELDASLRPMAEIKGLRLHTQLEARVPRVIHTDRIRLQSAPDEGSCFTVHLPVRVVAQEQTEPAADTSHRSGDGPAVLAEEAHANGFASVHCRSGGQALNLLQSEHFSAVILDILPPDIRGWQLFRRLRGQASHRSTPVHIISCVPQPLDWNDDGACCWWMMMCATSML